MKIERRSLALALAVLVILLQTGCGTFEGLANSEGESCIYIGIRRDIEHITGDRHVGGSCLDLTDIFIPLYVIDFPLSLVLDTALLPFTIFYELLRPPRFHDKPAEIGK